MYDKYTKEQFDKNSVPIYELLKKLGLSEFEESHIIDELCGCYTSGHGRQVLDNGALNILWRLQDDGFEPYVVMDITINRQFEPVDPPGSNLSIGVHNIYPHQQNFERLSFIIARLVVINSLS